MRKPVIAIAVLTVLLGGYAHFYGTQTLAVLYQKRTPEEAPYLYGTPEPLAPEPDCPAGGATLAHFGWVFTVPWTGEVKEDVHPLVVTAAFEDNRGVIIFNSKPELVARPGMPPPPGGGDSPTGQAPPPPPAFPPPPTEHFEDYEAMAQATPGDLRIFIPREEALRLVTVLTFKEMVTLQMGPMVFRFETDNLRGFQFGVPGEQPQVSLVGFDAEDRKVHLILGALDKSTGALSQQDIGCVLQSLHPVEDAAGTEPAPQPNPAK